MPTWLSMWGLIDHCADWDYIWLTMLCRARKHTRTFDWASVAPQIFHAAQRIVQVPTGNGPAPGNRRAPHIERLLIGNVNTASERLSKIAKLVVSLIALPVGPSATLNAVSPSGSPAAGSPAAGSSAAAEMAADAVSATAAAAAAGPGGGRRHPFMKHVIALFNPR